jgi:hypothetical protein
MNKRPYEGRQGEMLMMRVLQNRRRRVVIIHKAGDFTAVWRKGRRFCTHSMALASGSPSEPSLETFRNECVSVGAPPRAAVIVVLGSDFAFDRLIELPTRDTTDAIRILQNEPRRYFPVQLGRYAVSAARVATSGRSSAYLAGIAPDELITAWRGRLSSGWKCSCIVPLASARVLGRGRIIRRSEDVEKLLNTDLPNPAFPTRRSLVGQPSSVLSALAATEALQMNFTRTGEQPRSARRSRRLYSGILAGACLLLALNLPLELWGLHREIEHVRTMRSNLRSTLSQAERGRRVLERTSAVGDSIARVFARSGRVSGMMLQLAQSVPLDTHVLSVRLISDTVFIEFSGLSAAATIKKLQGQFTAVRLAGPVRRESSPGAVPVERFRVLAAVSDRRNEGS